MTAIFAIHKMYDLIAETQKATEIKASVILFLHVRNGCYVYPHLHVPAN